MSANTEGIITWKPKEHIVWRVKGDLLVILDTVSGHYYTLNEVAVDLWRGLFIEKKSFAEVINDIRAQYPDAPDQEQLEADCRESLDFWEAEKLIDQSAG
jgi:hypothetical protein